MTSAERVAKLIKDAADENLTGDAVALLADKAKEHLDASQVDHWERTAAEAGLRFVTREREELAKLGRNGIIALVNLIGIGREKSAAELLIALRTRASMADLIAASDASTEALRKATAEGDVLDDALTFCLKVTTGAARSALPFLMAAVASA